MMGAFGKTPVGIALLLFIGVCHGDVNLPELPRGKGERCVEPTDVMRKNHMDFLNHQRDLTVRSGIRTARHSLVGCVECHARQNARGRFIAVDAPGEFCQSCHAFTGVKPDCFECHAAKPAAGVTHAGRFPTAVHDRALTGRMP